MVDGDVSRRAVLERAIQARGDLQQLTALIADERVVDAAPKLLIEAIARAIRARDDALAKMLEEPVIESMADLWKGMSEHQEDVDGLVSECLTLATGSMLRSQGADGGLCAIADKLLAEVVVNLPLRWEALTVPGLEDRTSYRTGVIGLRCSARRFWSLPVALHEMGHVIAQTLDTKAAGRASRNPVREILLDGSNRRQREELFADFFATFSMGPAYGAAAVMTKFDPKDARTQETFADGAASTATHPSVDKRVHLILVTLGLMDQAAGMFQHPYRKEIDALDAVWRSEANSAGFTVDVDPTSAKQLTALANRFWELANGPLTSAEHREPIGDSVENLLLGGSQQPPAATSVRDVVGTAWRLRLAGSEAAAIEHRALALCERMMKEF